MSERSVTHAMFTIERTYDHPPAKVFAAWSSLEAKSKWFSGHDDWVKAEPYKLDFRVGGQESSAGGPAGEWVSKYRATYQDIVLNERIVTTYEMYMNDVRASVSVATVEFKPAGKGTRLVMTEQGAFLDGLHDPKGREEGTNWLLDKMGKTLETA